MSDRNRRADLSTRNLEPAPLVVAETTKLLDRAQRGVLAEALRRSEETRNVVEDALLNYGRWLLVHIFEDNAKAALEGRKDNALWRELLHRSGGPTLRLSARFLHVAVAIAAHDKRIQDDSWRLLEPGRKELLLPLAEEPLMRQAAQHVVAMKLSQRATRDYVRGLRTERGKKVVTRSASRVVNVQLRKLRERISAPAFQRTLLRSLKDLGDDERAATKKELEAMRALTATLLDALRRSS